MEIIETATGLRLSSALNTGALAAGSLIALTGVAIALTLSIQGAS